MAEPLTCVRCGHEIWWSEYTYGNWITSHADGPYCSFRLAHIPRIPDLTDAVAVREWLQ